MTAYGEFSMAIDTHASIRLKRVDTERHGAAVCRTVKAMTNREAVDPWRAAVVWAWLRRF